MRLDQLEWIKSEVVGYEYAFPPKGGALYRNLANNRYHKYLSVGLGREMDAIEAQCWLYEQLKEK